MKTLVSFVSVFVLLSVITSATSSLFEWHKFKRDYNKHYASASEEAMRKQIFLENVNQMRAYQRSHPDATFTLAINHLADRRSEELNSQSEMHFYASSSVFDNSKPSMNLPDSLDWRTKGVITPVPNIGHAPIVSQVVAVELVESLHAIKTQSLEQGSIERLIDCCPLDADPFECIARLEGICRATDYPNPTGQCIPNKCQPFTHVCMYALEPVSSFKTGHLRSDLVIDEYSFEFYPERFNNITRLETRNETTMMTWIQDSPLYTGIDASSITFQLYNGGIYQDTTCSSDVIGRRMQLVGYGQSDSGEPFWICKNSHGEQWGENGYIRVLRGKNMCGIATQVIQIA